MEREQKDMKVHGVDGYNKSCKNCREYFWANRIDKKYCTAKCRSKHNQKKTRRKARIQGLLAKFGLGTSTKKVVDGFDIAKKIDYARLTFVLSVLGFLGSLGFYFGVLRQMYSPTSDRQKIEVLKDENSALKNTIHVLIEKMDEDGKEE